MSSAIDDLDPVERCAWHLPRARQGHRLRCRRLGLATDPPFESAIATLVLRGLAEGVGEASLPLKTVLLLVTMSKGTLKHSPLCGEQRRRSQWQHCMIGASFERSKESAGPGSVLYNSGNYEADMEYDYQDLDMLKCGHQAYLNAASGCEPYVNA